MEWILTFHEPGWMYPDLNLAFLLQKAPQACTYIIPFCLRTEMYAGSASEVEVSQEQGEFVILETIIEENGECDTVAADRDSKVRQSNNTQQSNVYYIPGQRRSNSRKGKAKVVPAFQETEKIQLIVALYIAISTRMI